MNNKKANNWLFRKRNKDIVFSYEAKQKFRYIKGSVLAIVCGLIIAGIIIAAQNVNPFLYIKELFDLSFNSLYLDQTIQWICIYIIAGLAVGIGFKSGLFNIGVSGQMLVGSSLSLIFYKLVCGTAALNAGHIIAMFIICVVSGALFAGIAGVLKAVFNIHEVVTTIMLNWTAWYLFKYIFLQTGPKDFAHSLKGSGIASSANLPVGQLDIAGSGVVIPVILAVLAVIVIAVVLSKTVFGFKLKSVGASPDASKYAGYNVKRKMIDAMLISGALAGVAAFIDVFTLHPNISFAVDNLPSIGYDSIAVTLVAFNNPIGIFFTSILWGILQSGGSSTASLFNLPNQMAALIFGVIVYFAAISVVFINWFPILKLRILVAVDSSKPSKEKIKNYHEQQLELKKKLMNLSSSPEVKNYKVYTNQQIWHQKAIIANDKSTLEEKQKAKETIKVLKSDMNLFVKDLRKNIKGEIAKINELIKLVKKDTYVEQINSAKEGIQRRKFNKIRSIETDAISRASLLKSDLLNAKDQYKKDLKAKEHWLKDQLKINKDNYKLELTQNDVWLESETGILNHYWEMFNGTTSAKGEISKIKINSKNKILNIKSNAQMAKLDLTSKQRLLEKELENKSLKQAQKNSINKQIRLLETKKQEITNKAKQEVAKEKQLMNKEIAKQKAVIKSLRRYYRTSKRELAKEKVSLNRINVKYTMKNAMAKDNYEAKKREIKDAWETKKQMIDTQASAKAYEQVKELVKDYKTRSKQMNEKHSIYGVLDRLELAKELKENISEIWADEYSPVDNNRWSNKRRKVYNYVDTQISNLNKISIVIEAKDHISMVEEQAKYIILMYNKQLPTFKKQYQEAKKANPVLASITYSKNVEKYIKSLEDTGFGLEIGGNE